MVRKIAYNCLKEILINNAYSNLVIKELPKTLSIRDRALITQIVYGTLQHWDMLNYQWRDLYTKKPSLSVTILINMSLYQMFYLERIPAYAIVDEAGKLCAKGQRSFVQAVLFECQRRKMQPPLAQNELEKCAIEASIPLWILSLWKSHYGEKKAIAVAQAMQTAKSQLVGRINPLKADLEAMRQDRALTFLDEWALTSEENLLESDYFKRGELVIQDYSSQQPVKLLDPKAGERILDACSAPGTKSGMIAAMMQNKGELIAADLSSSRLKLVEEMAQRLGITILKTQPMDASKADEIFELESFDGILLDVPCSGLGVLAHKPDLKFRIKGSDLDSLVQLQKQILESCVKLLKAGGRLVYSTCTLNKKENERQIEGFLAQHKEMHLEYEKTFFPDEGDQDGFYMAYLVKEKRI